MQKVHNIVLDAGPLISQTREEILEKGEKLFVTPAVIREVKDENARRRLELLKGDLTVQQPTKESIKYVTTFAKHTGDSLVLSTQDIEVIALAYELVGDKSKLRNRPLIAKGNATNAIETVHREEEEVKETIENDDDGFVVVKSKAPKPKKYTKTSYTPPNIEKLNLNEDSDDDWSDGEWISPDNVQEKMKDENVKTGVNDEDVDVAIASRDYAVQNTSLQMGICAINEQGLRIKQLKCFMQRCYACFKLIPLSNEGSPKQFCPQCGGHTLTRVSTSVDKYGQLHVHLKAKMQWITRGDRYTLPNPQSQRARRSQHDKKIEFYAEDQPEYLKAVKKQYIQQKRNAKLVNDYIGPSTVDSAMSPFAVRGTTVKVPIGRGRYANETGRKTELKY